MDLSSASDTALWEALLHSNEQAFAEIYDRYFHRLYEYAMRLHSEEELVKDTIQELFIKLWTNRQNLSDSVDLRPYLFVAMRSTLYNRLRPRRNVKLIAFDKDQHDFLAHFSTEHAYINNEQVQQQQKQIADALNQLNSRQKEIIYLRYFEEMDYDQIGAIMNISVKGAYKLSARALKNMRDIMQVSMPVLILMLQAYKATCLKQQ
ncbi:RNA polymerase sigma factor (sigma-70 family) [Chitinophaga dinghuensis]|uniref:RNA polymerase sigma factor (Sigma-70 family) n=1 Tax=Chitinophaga dinghuensis TaxID=1539050 RepID=A0A327VUU5_9BACT|nr:sigma-70 family RNA polymerase sigma factor [Chitinophaga dinghuensis]RAJ74991.1 RNA polymerase sigma factor (sigma-70 family) [Chitinophaga dinghuensis]